MKRHSKARDIKSKVLSANRSLRNDITKAVKKSEGLACTDISILVVEDDQDIAKTLERMLKKKGYNIQVAFDGLKGLRKLRNGHFDIVITDILMPKLDGIQLLEKIKEEYPTQPVIVITASEDEQVYQKLLSMGICAYVRKPFGRNQFLDVIEEVIQSFDKVEVPISKEEKISEREDELALIGV